MTMLDKTGKELVTASAYARVLHAGGGDIARKLQASLARACCAYALHRGGMKHEKLLNEMAGMVAKETENIKHGMEASNV